MTGFTMCSPSHSSCSRASVPSPPRAPLRGPTLHLPGSLPHRRSATHCTQGHLPRMFSDYLIVQCEALPGAGGS